MCAAGGVGQYRGGIELLGGVPVVVVEDHTVGETGLPDLTGECSATDGTSAIVHLEIGVCLRELLRHAQDRRHPDTAAQQHSTAGSGRKRKMVPWRADVDQIALLDLVMQGNRSAAA